MSYKGKAGSKVQEPQEGYDLYAPYYDHSLEYLDSFEQEMVRYMLGDLSGKSVLDLGCGTGRLFPFFKDAGADITGVDISSGMLEVCRTKFPGVPVVEGDVSHLPFDDERFDVVIASFLIVHLKKLESVCMEAYRVLKPGGIFLLTNINQRRAPTLKAGKEELVIRSYYHMPEKVIEALEYAFFTPEAQEFVEEGGTWITQIVKARKS